MSTASTARLGPTTSRSRRSSGAISSEPWARIAVVQPGVPGAVATRARAGRSRSRGSAAPPDSTASRYTSMKPGSFTRSQSARTAWSMPTSKTRLARHWLIVDQQLVLLRLRSASLASTVSSSSATVSSRRASRAAVSTWVWSPSYQQPHRADLGAHHVERLRDEGVARPMRRTPQRCSGQHRAGEGAAEVALVPGLRGELLVERRDGHALRAGRLQQRGEQPAEGLLEVLAGLERLLQQVVDHAVEVAEVLQLGLGKLALLHRYEVVAPTRAVAIRQL